ncbi:hypothetical protein [Candidatus Anaplasma sp. TIGMIC]|uniref:hypothetical protein n=1 Tax=Candidatus Anaplasma sp. TIGMIC TaxID=3020713 RepID=UPI00232F5DF3|nr:hypothetical protein [Candidatus Anaplasma sp. TIGMIC]
MDVTLQVDIPAIGLSYVLGYLCISGIISHYLLITNVRSMYSTAWLLLAVHYGNHTGVVVLFVELCSGL